MQSCFFEAKYISLPVAFNSGLPHTPAMSRLLLCLHGWGGSAESFTELRTALQGADLDILTPNLPGFGGQADPPHPWTIDDYADWVESWLEEQRPGHGRYSIVGHSHGGRIAIKLALRDKERIDHLFLCAAAGIRHARHFKRIIGLTLAKSGKFFMSIPGMSVLEPVAKKVLYKLVRVHDYEKANPVMRNTMILVTREDMRPLLPLVAVPTDLFWGEQDAMTPISDGIAMQKAIAGSHLHRFTGVRHGVHRDRAPQIAEVIRKTLLP